MSSNETYRIRPAGRHILTIGRDLIQDRYAAVVELVKNAYDADSSDVDIEFRGKPDHSGYSITITDHGHGMSRDTVINKWMVPSTADKLERRHSPSGRIMQGRKGVGRYAASVLGADLLLETVTAEGEKTTVLLEWNDFESAQYMDDVEVLIDTEKVSAHPGTKLTITGDVEILSEWNQEQFDKLRSELKKLISPVRVAASEKENRDNFHITFKIDGFPDVEDVDESIEPYPIFDLFDYRIAGTIHADGKGILKYSSQKARNIPEEIIQFDNDGELTGCGELVFDIRVYDREAEAIDSLIGRGLRDEPGNYLGKQEVRRMLNKYNGIGVYRNGFRIRPLGDADFDWLKLNERRIQTPALRVGSNQVIGHVQIQSDEESGLVEKSARDGLRDNDAFAKLKEITLDVITKLERRRFDYRKKAGLSRPALRVEQEFERLFSSDEMKQDVRSELARGKVSKETIDKVVEIIDKDTENRNKAVEEIRQAVAIYQGQATLGKIINVILHEGRQPLSYFRNRIPKLHYWYDLFQKTGNTEEIEECISIVDGVGRNADLFVKLFSRLDPLAVGNRSARKKLNLKKVIHNAISVFDEKIKKCSVTVDVDGPDDFQFSSWEQDIYAIFTNLVDNSIYWMHKKRSPKREIIIDIVTDDASLLYIDYRDTGPGIEPELIDSEVIFEPQFTTKPQGAGLGLAIAGEAATRNGLELKAFESGQGAYFRLLPKTDDE